MGKGDCTGTGQMNGVDVVTLALGDKLIAKIAPTEGNNLFSLIYDGTEVLHYDESKQLADFSTGTPVLFPFPNRIEDAMWQWKGKTRLQKKNGIPIFLHSLVYDEKSWEYDKPCVTENGALLNTWIDVNEAHPIYRGYPFRFGLKIDYLLTEDGLEISYTVENRSDEEMPYGFALHPYFRRIGQTKITVPSHKVYAVRDDTDPVFFSKIGGGYGMVGVILPTGERKDTTGTLYDLGSLRDVDTLEFDDVFTELCGDAVIDYTKERLRVVIESSEDFSHTVVYTPQGEGFFCIEPQTCATDAINLYARGVSQTGLNVLGAGQKGGGKVRLGFQKY